MIDIMGTHAIRVYTVPREEGGGVQQTVVFMWLGQ